MGFLVFVGECLAAHFDAEHKQDCYCGVAHGVFENGDGVFAECPPRECKRGLAKRKVKRRSKFV